MKILVIMIPTGKEDSPFGEWAKKHYCSVTKKNIDAVKASDTEYVFRFAESGMNPVEMAFYRSLDHLASAMVFEAAQNAEDEGFDAVMINCYGDPMVWELRQILNIPVIAIGEASLLTSTLMGGSIGIVHISPFNIPETQEHIERYGLATKVLKQRPIKHWNEGDDDDLVDCRNKTAAFIETARELVKDGCDVIIPACSIMSPMLKYVPGGEEVYPGGVSEVDGVPVVDVIGQAFKMAETMASLKNGGSQWISRHCLYAQPSKEVLEKAYPITHSNRYKFWDVKG